MSRVHIYLKIFNVKLIFSLIGQIFMLVTSWDLINWGDPCLSAPSNPLLA
jgi:hypothetical protein